jgi:hypothetical protein
MSESKKTSNKKKSMTETETQPNTEGECWAVGTVLTGCVHRIRTCNRYKYESRFKKTYLRLNLDVDEDASPRKGNDPGVAKLPHNFPCM